MSIFRPESEGATIWERDSMPYAAQWLADRLPGDFESVYFKLRALPYKEFLMTPYWKAVRAIVIHRDGYRCQYCRIEQDRLEVHHTTYANHGAEHLHLDDLRSACGWCHTLKTILASTMPDDEFAAKRLAAFKRGNVSGNAAK